MKKALALLLAVAATMSVGVTAFANDVNSFEDTGSAISSSDVSSSDISSSDVSSSEASSSEVSSSEVSSSEVSSSEAETPAVDPSAFVFGNDAETGASLADSMLEPGTEYKFPVSMVFGDKTEAMTEAMIKDFKFTYSKVSTNGVKTFEIKEYKNAYYLHVEVKESTPIKPVDVKYNVKLVKKSNNIAVFSQEVKFQYGYDESNGDYINGLDKGDIVEIDNTKPVVTANQFDKIAKINDYKNVTLAGSSWKFTVNVTDETTKNMISNNAGIKEILSKLPDQDFKFYNFSGKPTFSATGRVALDVSDIVDDFSKLYTYRYANGKLYKLNASFNEEDNTLEFRTNKLDNFVVTDKAIKDGFVVSESNNNTDTDTDNDGDEDKNNPTTGASDMVNVAVMTAIASLAAAGTIAVKKASK